jgi:hypothetical protein
MNKRKRKTVNTQTSANKTSKGRVIREVVQSLLINGLAPYLVYTILSGHLSDVAALSIAASVPALDNLVSFLRYRRLDVFGSFILLSLVISIGVVLLGGDAKFILIKESFVTAGLGVLLLGSLLLPRPLIFYFAVHFSAGHDAASRANFSQYWQYPYFRFVMYTMTIVWGLSLVSEAIIRTILVFSLNNTKDFLAISPFVTYGILGLTIAWTVWFARRARRREAATHLQRENQFENQSQSQPAEMSLAE